MVNRYHFSGLLFAAFLVWLVHSMVPHHHHGTEICFVSHHCHESGCSHEEVQGSTCQQHNHPGSEECCVLRKISFLPVKQMKAVVELVPVRKAVAESPFALVPDLENPGPGFIGQKWKYFAGSPQAYTNFLIHCCGLRAPPAV